ncbi:uncharacterized protein BXZ73DRAFT_8936, partial [Epithele typhae]|uniref:uncharacterized protein n=1 Tax=Epithele typhae TaxID=378194 RepID=UPI00200728DB
ADAPFNRPSADTILRTADHVDFHVHRIILIQASPFFADMFSLPQPQNVVQDAPVIDVSEDSKTLRHLLQICYPTDRPVLESLDDLVPVLRAAMKYSMDWLAKTLSKSFIAAIPQFPFQVWAHACRSDLPEVARQAIAEIKGRSTETITATGVLDSLLQDAGLGALEGISSGTYYRLRECLRDGDQSTFTVEPLPNPLPAQEVFSCITEPPPDVAFKCSDDVVIHAHKVIVALHIPDLLPPQGTQSLPCGTADESEPLQTIPIYGTSMRSATLSDLLRACYGGAPAIPADTVAVARMLLECQKSHITTHLATLVKKQWDDLASSSPLAAYFAAVQQGLPPEIIQAAARNTLDIALPRGYTPCMEDVPASAYHFLLQFHSAATEAASGQ